MNNQITVEKYEGKSVKGFMKFPIQNGRKIATVQIIERRGQFAGTYLYVTSTIRGAGAVFGTFPELQAKYRALSETTEAEILGEIA